jgi:hypothetical protein
MVDSRPDYGMCDQTEMQSLVRGAMPAMARRKTTLLGVAQ